MISCDETKGKQIVPFFLGLKEMSMAESTVVTPKLRDAIMRCGVFDEEYYIRNYPEVKDSSFTPLEYYMRTGMGLGHSPSHRFNPLFYIHNYPEVNNSGLNPLMHYSLYGLDNNAQASRLKLDIAHIDIMDSCNLRCRNCPRRSTAKSSALKMDSTLLTKILNKISHEYEVRTIGLYNWCEPLLHPDIAKFVDIVLENGFTCQLSTNLSINNTARLEQVYSKPLEQLIISTSGFYMETYGKGHCGGDIELVKKNLIFLRSLVKSGKCQVGHISVHFHMYSDNYAESVLFDNFAQELGFGFMRVNAIAMPIEDILHGMIGGDDFDSRLINKPSPRQVPLFQHCPMRERVLVVGVSGEARLCCVVFNEQGILGDFLSMSAVDILKMKQSNNICTSCLKFNLPSYVGSAVWNNQDLP